MITGIAPQTQAPRSTMLAALAQLRQEWSEATDGSLLEVETSVGLLLADVARLLGLSPAEQQQVLGADLYAELNCAIQFDPVRYSFVEME